ncbi:MAG: hypothetical protein LC687_04975 [Actinobacteria bacterium]|nr:hypothetical protein [Actinomycetota bacterium]MCA1807187.1 hypothetical protein [Actinomycetota bacterium]
MPTFATYQGWADIREVSAAMVNDLVEGHTMKRFPKNQKVEVSPELAQALQDDRFGGDFKVEELEASPAEDGNTESEEEASEDIVTPSTGDAVSTPSTRSTPRASTRNRS